MPIKLLRWQSGMAGDTVLKLILDSDQNLQSQTRYVGLQHARTLMDFDYCQNFKYQQISQMSLVNWYAVDRLQLFDQLRQLEQDNVTVQWILKTHCYFNFEYPVIDIVSGPALMPFVVKAGLAKNSRETSQPNYHTLISKIKDPEILYKFDCFNYAQDLCKKKKISDYQIDLQNILGGWNSFITALHHVGLEISIKCQVYYTAWLEQNKQFMPSKVFTQLIENQQFDYNHTELTLEEKYCMLSLSGHKFKVLT
jgi:hypothetical protein